MFAHFQEEFIWFGGTLSQNDRRLYGSLSMFREFHTVQHGHSKNVDRIGKNLAIP